MVHVRVLVIACVLLGTMVLGFLVASAERVVLVKLPGHPAAVSVYDGGGASAMLVSLFKPGSGEELVRVIGGDYWGWYKLVPGSGFFRAYSLLLLRGDRLYIYGVEKTGSNELVPVLVTASLKTGRGVVETIVVAGNKSLSIVSARVSVARDGGETRVVYVATLVKRSPGANASGEVFVPEGLLLAQIGLRERLRVSSFFFPVRNVLFTTQSVAGEAIYVAGIRIGEIEEVMESLPGNTAILIGVVHGDTMVLHEYSVPGCIMPSDILVANNTLYLRCVGSHGFNLVLLAVNLATWEPVWSASYNATALVLGARDTALTMTNDTLYVPIATGLIAINPETGKPIRAITLAKTPRRHELGLVSTVIARVLGKPYLIAMNITGYAITLVPLRFLEGAQCIQAGDIVLGETKLAWTRLSSKQLGEEMVKGRPIPVALFKASSLIIEKYRNAVEEYPVITHPENCRPVETWLKPAKTILKATILTIKNKEPGTDIQQATTQKKTSKEIELAILGVLAVTATGLFMERSIRLRRSQEG